MYDCYLSLGANLGDRKKNIRQAIELISQLNGIKLISVSNFYETEPWGVENQPKFVNAAVRIKTELEPLTLLDALQAIEYKLGRVRHGHWEARTIDIDILNIDNIVVKSERLTLPHPLMFLRDFVMVPLEDITDIKFELHGDKISRTTGCLVDFNLKMIACVDKQFGLGNEGKLLFHINEDLKRFRKLTFGNTVIMGRKTFSSIGHPLDGRRNIILSKTLNEVEGVEIVEDLEALYNNLNVNEANFVIGGGAVYSQLLPFMKEAFISVVDEVKAADVFLENLDNRDDFICDLVEVCSGFEVRHYIKNSMTP